MKVVSTILAACLLLAAASAKDAEPVAAESSKGLVNVIFDVARLRNGVEPLKPTTIIGDVACYVQYQSEDINILKIAGEQILQCRDVSMEELERIYNTQLGRMAINKLQQDMLQCKTSDTSADREDKLDCFADVIVEAFKRLRTANTPIIWQTKLCVRYELHEMDKRFYRAFKELNKCMWRTNHSDQQQQQQQQQSSSGSQQQQQQ